MEILQQSHSEAVKLPGFEDKVGRNFNGKVHGISD